MSVDEDQACHDGRIDLEAPGHAGAPAGTGTLTANFVHYPGSQQLQLWLPQGGPGGYTDWRRVDADGRIAAQGAVADVLAGPVKMLLDTLAWPPGVWRLEVHHADGWLHTLPMRKHPQGHAAAPSPAAAADAAGTSGGGTHAAAAAPLYRDGVGRVVPDAERLIRERALAQLADRFSCKVSYEGYGRAGTYTWAEGDRRLRFDQEMGARPCQAVVSVPRPASWEAVTGMPLARRDEIVQQVAAQARRDFGSRVEIRDDSIAVY